MLLKSSSLNLNRPRRALLKGLPGRVTVAYQESKLVWGRLRSRTHHGGSGRCFKASAEAVRLLVQTGGASIPATPEEDWKP